MRKKIIVLYNFFVMGTIIFSFMSCEFYPLEIKTVDIGKSIKPMDEISPPNMIKRKWTIFIYMAADNDLEPSAIEDIYEMEISKLNTKEVSVFILLDRSSSYDTSNNDWTGTKLYKLKTGRSRECKTIISEEIPCEELNLNKNKHTELDMSSGYCLSKSLNYVINQYPAEKIGFIMWGHGSGWRNNCSNDEINHKGFAYDDSTGLYMTLKQFGRAIDGALNNYKLDFIGLDTCFGGEIEVMYELRNRGKFAVGAEGLLRLSGWNYERIFNNFQGVSEKSAVKLIDIVIDSFSKDYELSSAASIVGVNLMEIENYFTNFDKLMKIIAENISTRELRDSINQKLYSQKKGEAKVYSYGKQDSDVYLDINSIFKICKKTFSDNENIQKSLALFNSNKEKCIFNSWASDGEEGGLGVYYGTLTAGNLVGIAHDSGYIKGNELEQIDFVKNSKGYVPGVTEGNSFLDKLFYTKY